MYRMFPLPAAPLPRWLGGQEGIPVEFAETGQTVYLPTFRESMLLLGQTGYAKTTLIRQYLDGRFRQ